MFLKSAVTCYKFVCVLGMMVKTVFGLGEHVAIQVRSNSTF